MIKYTKVEKEYKYDIKTINDILFTIESFYEKGNCSKEDVDELLSLINKFIDTCIVTNTEMVSEKIETEKEAREYFGDNFIKEFDSLLKKLEEEQVVPALHATIEVAAKSILNTGLEYQEPSIYGTAKVGDVKFNSSYDNYADFLNSHYGYKYLVIVGIPYECFYDRPLWNHFKGGDRYDYKINPDFIVGYIDVSNKQIIYNQNYLRNHDYSGLVHDTDIYHKRNINNEEFLRLSLEYKVENGEVHDESDYYAPYRVNINNNRCEDNIFEAVELLKGLFNEIKGHIRRNDIFTQDRHEQILSELLTNITIMQMTLPYLKTKEELQADIDNSQQYIARNNNVDDFNQNDDFWDWGFDDKISDEKQSKNR